VRFSPFHEDHATHPKVYRTESDVVSAVKGTYLALMQAKANLPKYDHLDAPIY
jgi:hypothetical protein